MVLATINMIDSLSSILGLGVEPICVELGRREGLPQLSDPADDLSVD